MKREKRGSARRELIAIQKRLYRRLRREIQSSLDEQPGNVAIYLEEYERELADFEAPATRDDLLASVLSADLVYVGDYHTLRQSQRTLLRLLTAATLARPEVILALELVHANQQQPLDAYMAGQIDDDEFKRLIRYEETWGFEWRNYRELFTLARRRNVRVVGINSDPKGHDRDHLLERDLRAAEVVVRETLAHPRALVFVFDGDLHVARDHLPLVVDSLLTRVGSKREKTIVHQNAEAIYWRMAAKGKEHEASVVRLRRDAYVVFNASPIEKLQSYINWQSERDELTPKEDSDWAEIMAEDEDDLDDEEPSTGLDESEQVLGFIQTLARFLGIERDDLDDFELFTVKDLDLLDYLSDRFTRKELDIFKRQVEAGESFFFPKGNIIYLGDLSVSNAAEEAAHFLHFKCSGTLPRDEDRFFGFYVRAIAEALGFFGSKVVNPKRECWREADCLKFLLKYQGTRGATPEERFQRQACELVVQHKANERRKLDGGRWSRLSRMYEQDDPMYMLVTHMLGHMLGERLYDGLVRGSVLVTKDYIRSLFHERLDTAEKAFERYMDLVAKTLRIESQATRI